MNKSNIGRAIIFSSVLVLGVCIFLYKDVSAPAHQEAVKNSTQPIFTWKFEEDNSLNLDGLPQTNVFLEAYYPNGTLQRKLIDTTPGGCNELSDTDEDTLARTSTIQCYYAGLGYRFKIIQDENEYLVQRKTVEEALPEYYPPDDEFETIATFSK